MLQECTSTHIKADFHTPTTATITCTWKKEINLFDHKEANKPKIKKQKYSQVVLEPVSMTRSD